MEHSERDQRVSTAPVTPGELVYRGALRSKREVTDEACNKRAGCLEHGAPEKRLSAADGLDEIKSGNSTYDGDSAKDSLNHIWREPAAHKYRIKQQCVRDSLGACALEERVAVVVCEKS